MAKSTVEAKAYKLTGIARAAGQCASCGTELSVRVFTVKHTVTGDEIELGRRCAAKATGYPTTRLERELAVVARIAEVGRRETIVYDAYPVWAAIVRQDETDRVGDPQRTPCREWYILSTATTTDWMWREEDGRSWRGYLAGNGAS